MTARRILCISSDRSVREAVRAAAADSAGTAVLERSAVAAAARLERERFDAVVVDAGSIGPVDRLAAASTGQEAPTRTVIVSPVAASADGVVSAVREAIEPAPGGPSSDGDGRRTRDPATEPVDLERRITYRLADATSPDRIDRAIREGLIESDRYRFAWLGEYDRGERGVVPWVTGETPGDWSVTRSFSVADGDHPVLERTLRTRSVQVVDPLEADTSVPLAETAIEDAVEAVMVAPLATEDDLYGLLVAYLASTVTDRDLDLVASITETATRRLEDIDVRGTVAQQTKTLRRYERLVETAGDGMYVLDAGGHFTTVNDALVEMTGYSREGLLGEHASVLFGTEGTKEGAATIESLLEGDADTDTLESPIRTKDGEEIPCETQIALLTHDGELQGSVGVVRDVTERKRRERQLREQNERLDAFASIVSHDLRNPLGVAQGYVDLALDTGDVSHLDAVEDGLDRMEAIISDVLAIAREGEWAADVEPVDLETVATDAWDSVQSPGARLAVDGTTTIQADRSRLLRLLENLFRNSVEHGSTSSRRSADDSVEHGSTSSRRSADRVAPATGQPGDAELTVSVGLLPDEDGFFVADDGPGLPASMRDGAFDGSFATESEGTGIGLWIVGEVARGHGWSAVATESETGGARFEFRTSKNGRSD